MDNAFHGFSQVDVPDQTLGRGTGMTLREFNRRLTQYLNEKGIPNAPWHARRPPRIEESERGAVPQDIWDEL